MRNLINKNPNKFFIGILFLLVPILFAGFFTYYLEIEHKSQNLKRIKKEIKTEIQILKDKNPSQKYIIHKLNLIFIQNYTCASFKNKLLNFLHQNELHPEYLIWTKKGKIYSTNFSESERKKNWKRLFKILYKFKVQKIRKNSSFFPKNEVLTLRKLLGPLSFHRIVNYSSSITNPIFSRTSLPNSAPLLWVSIKPHFGGIIRIKEESFNKNLAVINFVKKKNSNYLRATADYLLAFKSANKLYFPKYLNKELIKKGINLKHNPLKETCSISNFIIYPNKINQSKLIAYIPKTSLIDESFAKVLFFSRLILFLILFLSSIALYKLQDQNSANIRAGIKLQLNFLFLISFITPALILIYISFDYLKHYKISRINYFHRLSMRFLRNIDSMKYEPKTKLIQKLKPSIKQLKADLKNIGPNKQTIKRFSKNLDHLYERFFIISSSTSTILSSDGIIKNGKLTSRFKTKTKISNSALFQQMSVVDKISKFFLAELNNTKLSNKLMTEVEMIVEEFGKETPVELIQEFYEALNSFFIWGFGKDCVSTYIEVFNLFSTKTNDYSFLYIPKTTEMGYDFIKRNIFHIARNEANFKVIALKWLSPIFPKNEHIESDLYIFARQLKQTTDNKLSLINYKGKPHIVNGIRSSIYKPLRYITLFPIEKIDAEIEVKKRQLKLFGLASLLTSVLLAFFLSNSILIPIYELQKGLKAFEDKNFSYRIPKLGNDEFGKLASFYNETLNDLEELQVAKIIQEKLIPQWKESQSFGNFKVYGKTTALDALGGDYFDSLEISKTHHGILIGDVAGHGTAAALIMAFIKSCIIQFNKLYKQPHELINKLNTVFRKTKKGNQRKIMTFQYLFLDTNIRNVSIVNAGHCFPILIDFQNKSAEFLELINPPLGASKRENKGQLDLVLEQNQALVLYSDGFYETGNVGFEKFKEILITSYAKNPKVYYENVLANFFKIVDSADADDMTLIIIS